MAVACNWTMKWILCTHFFTPLPSLFTVFILFNDAGQLMLYGVSVGVSRYGVNNPFDALSACCMVQLNLSSQVDRLGFSP